MALDFVLLHLADPHAAPRCEKYIDIHYSWRLETRSSIVAGSADLRPYIEATLLSVIGRRLANATVDRPSFMLRLKCEENLYLWIVPHRSDDFMVEGTESAVPWYVGGHAIDDALTPGLT
jgi:hypothetical protein